MFKIRVANRQSLLKIDAKKIREIAKTTLAAEQVSGAEIDIAILDDAAIHQVNRDHLQHNYPTDVISFLYSEEEEEEVADDVPFRGAGLKLEGEVVASAETAIRMAAEAGWSAEAELTLYLVHGLLHLCGYDDLSEEEQVLMRQREREILKNWNLAPRYSPE